MHRSIYDFSQFKDYIARNEPIDIGGAKVIGWFPYETAGIYGDIPKVPRKVFSQVEDILRDNHISDNKYVIICQDTERFGTNDFAIFFHDAGARVGKLQDVVGYANRELR